MKIILLDSLRREGAEIALPLIQLIALSLLLHLLTCFASIGFYQPDEHFQILEFAHYKMGNGPAEDLPWEFHEQIRPCLQPTLAMFFFSGLQWLGIQNPFTWNLLLKIITSCLAFGSLLLVALHYSPQLKTQSSRRLLWLSSLFLWFMPYLHIRFTGENISGILFIAAVLLLLRFPLQSLRTKRWPELAAGALLGLAFYLRFQMGFALAGMGLWLLFVQRRSWASITRLALGFSLMIALNIGVDYWFYGDWVISPYNYFYANIIEDKAAGFGVSPWYDYLPQFLLGAAPPLSLLLLFLFGWGAWQKRQSIWVWSCIPFLLGHMLVGHKELRFLFPMLYLFPVLLAQGWEAFNKRYQSGKWKRWLGYFFIAQNIVLLLIFTFPPIHRLLDYNEYFMKALYQNTERNSAQTTLLSREGSPYNTLKLMMNYYVHPQLQWKSFDSDEALLTWLEKQEELDHLLFYKEGFEWPEAEAGFEFEAAYRMFPDWMQQYNPYDWQEKVPIKNLYWIKRSDAATLSALPHSEAGAN
ncbi:MAG: hypothetical protein AAGG75_06625 [Bacteroidota bacterium]